MTVEADYWCYAYHHVNGFENEDGKIVFDTCTWDKFTLYFTDICSPNGEDNYPRMKLSLPHRHRVWHGDASLPVRRAL